MLLLELRLTLVSLVASSVSTTREKPCFYSSMVLKMIIVDCSLLGVPQKTAAATVPGHVIRLDLHSHQPYICLDGEVNPSLFELKHLKYLDLGNNFFGQTIPKSIDSLTYLEHLKFSNSGFFGEIPSQLGNLSKLSSLDLSDNLRGVSAKSLQWLSRLTLLREIHLTYIDLSRVTDWVQTINKLPSLRVLYLDDCYIPATIPSSLSFINSSAALRVVSLPSNFLSDASIFQWLFNLSRKGNQFVHLDLSYNSFSGPLPNEVGNMHSLSYLSLSDNNLEGHIPDNFSNPRSLRTLSLSNNNFHGSISKSLCNLQELYLYGNSYDEDLSNFIGTLSTGCANKPLLEYLDLSMNQLWGSVPDMISTFSSMRELYLDGNLLNGTISQGVGKLSMLEKLDVSNCSLKATLNHNHFANLSRCPKNKITLRFLDLSNNLFLGELPDCWIKLDQLVSLHLENNKFSGNIPTSIGSLQSLRYLHLDNNKFSGNILTSIGTLQFLQFLHLENNSFSGELPASLDNCSYLNTLELAYNPLTGHIPSCIGNAFKDLAILNLRGNKFIGRLPLSICQMSNLQILDIAHNQISGTIPSCIYNLTGMSSLEDYESIESDQRKDSTVIEWKRKEQRLEDPTNRFIIDLSRNELEGEIPDGISNLTMLVILDLSRNKLTGSIISNIGKLTSLEFLDFSNNQLSGVIPISLAELSFLGILDLSNNNLSGKIPLGTQLQSFDPSSYEGNPLLCGAPLQECPGDEPPTKTINGQVITWQDEHGNDDTYPGLYITVLLGFIIGFWGVCGTLVLKTSWRHAFFRFFDDLKDKSYVFVVLNVARCLNKP